MKWDHNRDLLEAGTGRRDGAAAVHEQTLAFYALLDALRAAHPEVDWESCASGGGRIDFGVLEKVQRFWGSDMTDAVVPPADPALDHPAAGTRARRARTCPRPSRTPPADT